ncbi:MAG TPA: hypothetical protein VHC44_17170 [Verrucomicrobiae bacterium]|nr:hypothetical protein [Verrucomicrobiae bacterium]
MLLFVLLLSISFVFSGCAVNGKPMRFEPSQVNTNPALSWYIEGTTKPEDKTQAGAKISCSFVEFDERGDFIDFRQHRDCEAKITNMVAAGPVLLVMYCHGWKNNSQSDDVIRFNSFLAKIASSDEVLRRGYRVHGVYLSWRGNVVHPYIDKSDPDGFYQDTTNIYEKPIVDSKYNRWSYWLGFLPENVDFFTRQRAAEHLVSALPMARAIFTYASAAKNYGAKMDNQVFVMGHSMGALMLERSLGQAMTGSLVMEWWDGAKKAAIENKPALPFDFILLLNSAAPSLYAKEMRDFLEANRRALRQAPGSSFPVIVSLTSTADGATGGIYPMAHTLDSLRPSLQREYTTAIFGTNGETHAPIRQYKFYNKTPGHQPYLINHWIIPEKEPMPKAISGTKAVFEANLSRTPPQDPHIFYTSNPLTAWCITNNPVPPYKEVKLNGRPLAMQDSDYWIVNCGKKLIASHGDIWSTKTMEMYAGLYRLAVYLKEKNQESHGQAPPK